MAPHLYRELLIAGAKALLRTRPCGRPGLDRRAGADRQREEAGRRCAVTAAGALPARDVLRRTAATGRTGARQAEARGCDKRRPARECSSGSRGSASPTTRTRGSARPRSRERRPRHASRSGTSARCRATLDKIAARTGLIPPQMPVFFTEFGYQTLPRTRSGRLGGGCRRSTSTRLTSSPGVTRGSSRPPSSSSSTFRRAREFPRDTPAYWSDLPVGALHRSSRRPRQAGANAYKFPARRQAQGRHRAHLGPGPLRAERRDLHHHPPAARTRLVDLGDAPATPVQVTHSQGFFRARRPTQRGASWRAVWGEPDFARFEISREAVAR